jgi:hypothetical protein
MSVISRSDSPRVDAIQSGRSFDERPLTYGLLRQVLVYSGSIDEREAQKMDRAFHRLLHT